MINRGQWLFEFSSAASGTVVEGVVPVRGYDPAGRAPEEVVIMEKAAHYGADAVFFEASRDSKPPTAQAFIYRSDGPTRDPAFAKRHQQLWSWGGVPLVYRVTNGLVQLFRCAHRPDFEKDGEIVFKPFKTLRHVAQIAADPWWDADRIHNGTLWDEPEVCKELLSSKRAAQKTLINAVKELHQHLNKEGILPKALRRKQFRTETGDETQGGRKIDMTAKPRGVALIIEGRRHSQFDALFPIECKRLPTPAEKDRDEREYVITEPGTTGGIQRFKFGHHGAAHNFAAMIAYVQEQSFSHWLGKVNGWIHDLSQVSGTRWSDSDAIDRLSESSEARVCTLESRHRRDGLEDCELRHLWIDMN